jgi:hypothetical protein
MSHPVHFEKPEHWKRLINEHHREFFRKMIHYGVAFGAGDVLAQFYRGLRYGALADAKSDAFDGPSRRGTGAREAKYRTWDHMQSIRSMLFGAYVFQPMRHYWNRSMDRIFPMIVDAPWASQRETILKRLANEHIIMTPVTCAAFLIVQSVLELDPFSAPQRAAFGMWPTTWQSWAVWLPSQGALFCLAPVWSWAMLTNATVIFWAGVLAQANLRVRAPSY